MIIDQYTTPVEWDTALFLGTRLNMQQKTPEVNLTAILTKGIQIMLRHGYEMKGLRLFSDNTFTFTKKLRSYNGSTTDYLLGNYNLRRKAKGVYYFILENLHNYNPSWLVDDFDIFLIPTIDVEDFLDTNL